MPTGPVDHDGHHNDHRDLNSAASLDFETLLELLAD